MQFGEYMLRTNPAARKIDSDAILELKFKEEPFSFEVVSLFSKTRWERFVKLGISGRCQFILFDRAT
ncbi:MAG: hypothetical protein CM15mP74_27290 [Halieaceae bacterium]|nr:MAG: hypothetical protein CM15mP74_27290 [Halieaceae bacterium]